VSIVELKQRDSQKEDHKLDKLMSNFKELIEELQKKEVPQELEDEVSQIVLELNSSTLEGKKLRGLVFKKSRKTVQLIISKLNLFPINYHRKQWLVLGMSIFGAPIGVALGISLGSMAFLGLGLPIGMIVGIAVGTNMDRKAKAEGRQLDVEVFI
jgi:hypothetical protein